MRCINELMLMISSFLFGAIDAKEFYDDYEQRFLDLEDGLHAENEAIETLLSDIAYECAFFDAHNTKEAHLYDTATFKWKISDIYSKIIPLALVKKVS